MGMVLRSELYPSNTSVGWSAQKMAITFLNRLG